MSERQSRGAVRGVVLMALVVAPVTAGLYWFFACPCGGTPGGYLLGAEAEVPIDDWSFANDVTLCQIQVSAGLLPHSVNLNCMSTTTGDLYLSCGQCDGKHWSNAAGDNSTGRLRLNATVYPVTLTRVTDPTELDRVWDARATKLNSLSSPATAPPPPGTPRPDSWGTFRVVSR